MESKYNKIDKNQQIEKKKKKKKKEYHSHLGFCTLLTMAVSPRFAVTPHKSTNGVFHCMGLYQCSVDLL